MLTQKDKKINYRNKSSDRSDCAGEAEVPGRNVVASGDKPKRKSASEARLSLRFTKRHSSQLATVLLGTALTPREEAR